MISTISLKAFGKEIIINNDFTGIDDLIESVTTLLFAAGYSLQTIRYGYEAELQNVKDDIQFIIEQAKKAATDTFNSMPFEIRKKLANGYDRLHEIEILLSKGDRLSLADVKKRKRHLEQWLLEWYNENKI